LQPVLLYGSGSLVVTKADENKLNVFERKVEKYMDPLMTKENKI
jgi:hypothetical protein